MSMRHAPTLKLKSGGEYSDVRDGAEMAAEAFAGDCMYGEAVVALLKCKKNALEMNSWILDDILRPPFMKNIIVNLDLKVKDLIDPISMSWDEDSLRKHFFPRNQAIIRRIKPATTSQDFMVWLHNRSGEYSVRSGYWLASHNHNIELQIEAAALPSLNPIKDKIWIVLASSKMKMFLWKAVRGALPVAERLLTRGVRIDPRCRNSVVLWWKDA
ncbi:unnamed protein product [Arabidopsis halleri]